MQQTPYGPCKLMKISGEEVVRIVCGDRTGDYSVRANDITWQAKSSQKGETECMGETYECVPS